MGDRKLAGTGGLAIRPDGSLVIGDDDDNVNGRTTNRRVWVRTIDTSGTLDALAATADVPGGVSSFASETGLAIGNGPYYPRGFGSVPNGDVLVVSYPNVFRVSTRRVAGVAAASQCPAGATYQVPSGGEIFCFDATGRHHSTVNARTGKTLLKFDYAAGVLSSITDAKNGVTTITKATGPSRYEIVAPGKQKTTIALDANGWASSIGDTLGSTTLTTRSNGLLDDLKDRKTQLFDFDYEADGRLKSDTNARGTQTLTLETLSNGRRVTHKTPLGRTTTFEMVVDDKNVTRHTTTLPDLSRVIKTSSLDGVETVTSADGTITSVSLGVDPLLGDNSLATVRTTTTLPSGLKQVVQQELGEPTDITDGRTRISKTLYGAAADAPFVTTTHTYSTTGAILADIGAAQKFVVDSPLHRKTTLLLDATDNPLKLQIGGLTPVNLGYETVATSENFGKLKTISQGARAFGFEYQSKGSGTAPDDAGYLLRVTSPYSKEKYSRDLHGRVKTVLQAEGVAALAGTTTFGWDLNGQLESLKIPSTKSSSPEHKWAYDSTHLLGSYTPPPVTGVFEPKTTYLPTADLVTQTETRPKALSTDTAVTVSRAYVTTSGQLDTIMWPANGTLYPAGTVDYDYYSVSNASGSASGEVSTLRGPYAVNLAYQYDGKLPTKVTWSGDVSGSVSWNYDSNFSIQKETVAPAPASGSAAFTFGYDNDQLLTCVSSSASDPCAPAISTDLVLARSADHGLVTDITIGSSAPNTNTLVEHLDYSDAVGDDGGADTDVTQNRAFGELRRQGLKVNGTESASIVYDAATERRDDEGRIRFKTETFAGIVTDIEYQYDERNRLDFVQTGLVTESFGYDLNGNRTSYVPSNGIAMTGVYDDQDRLTSYGATAGATVGDLTFAYGANGELRTKSVKTAAAPDVWTFGYDPSGNLVTVAKPGGITYTYLIDGRGRRVGKKEKIGTAAETIKKRWLYHDELNPVAELNAGGALVARYVYASRTNVPDLVIKGSKVYRLFSDQRGSPRLAVNVADPTDIPYRVDYSAFGKPVWKGTGVAATPAFDWIPFGFAGGMYDPDTGLVRFGARDYDPNLGRWTSKDPSGMNGGQTNFYVYVGNDPVNHGDPNGKIWIIEKILCLYYSSKSADDQEECTKEYAGACGADMLSESCSDYCNGHDPTNPTDDVMKCMNRKDPGNFAKMVAHCTAFAVQWSLIKKGSKPPIAESIGKLRKW